ncbi:MAG: hypothetical protein LBO69_01810 [Ignavibacteria bacterium]|jgi:hypothetical protein|nr:hypothetical protein [Ignavibacteria bacterium]
MAAKSRNQALKELNVGAQHFFVMLIMIVGFFLLFQYIIIPAAFGGFVRSLFAPYGEMLEKTGYAEFKDGVWASISKDNEKNSYKSTPVSGDVINKEYIFDFSWERRTPAINGYAKEPNEFYSKCPKLGENAIIIEPWVCLWLLALVAAIIVSLLISSFMPASIGYMSALFFNQVEGTKVKLRLQTGLTDDVIDLLVMPDDQFRSKDVNEVKAAFRLIWNRTVTEDISSTHAMIAFDEVYYDDVDIVHFRNEIIYKRIKEFYSDFLLVEIEDTKKGILWTRNHLKLLSGMRLYMSHHFCEKYQNTVTGMAYGGAAFLIVFIGIRGLKFIPADKPSFIFLSIILEFSMLSLMAVTLVFTEGEERMDKLMKKMEDANRSSLDSQKLQQADIHMLTNALVGQTASLIKDRVEKAIEEFMTSNNEVEKKIAVAVADRILIGLKSENPK